jgi:hypothetical protein
MTIPDGYYLSAAWRAKRQKRLEVDRHKCQGCGITAEQLQALGWPPLEVHHKNDGPPAYRYPSLGNELLGDLLTLCRSCHDGITDSVRRQRFALDPAKQVEPNEVQRPEPHIPNRGTNRVRPESGDDHTARREPAALPQRADCRSAQLLRQGDEGCFQQEEKN